MNHQKVVESFKDGKERRGSRIYAEDNNLYSYGRHFILAAKRPAEKSRFKKEWYLLNGDKYSVSTSKHQRIVFKFFHDSPSISFTALSAAGLYYTDVNLVDFRNSQFLTVHNPDKYSDNTTCQFYIENKEKWDNFTVPIGATYYERTDPETGIVIEKSWHRIGAVLLESSGKYYLCAMDEGSYFISLLPRKVISIEAAFNALKPRQVIDAEKNGLKVIRQGEWFFIPMPDMKIKEKDFAKQVALPATAESSNQHVCKRLIKIDGKYYAKGRVRHVGRFGRGQHKTIVLGNGQSDVYMAVKNTSKGDWSSNGNVD